MILALGVRNALDLRVCVSSSPASVLSMHSQNSPPKHTRETHKSANSQTHTRTQTGPSTEPPIQTTPTSNTITPKPNQNHTHTTHHTTPPHTKHTNKKPKKNTKRGQGEIEERGRKEREEKEKRGGERRRGKTQNGDKGESNPRPPPQPTRSQTFTHAPRDPQRIFCGARSSSGCLSWEANSPARFSPPSVQARERFVQATRSDARPWEKTNLPCCGWKI